MVIKLLCLYYLINDIAFLLFVLFPELPVMKYIFASEVSTFARLWRSHHLRFCSCFVNVSCQRRKYVLLQVLWSLLPSCIPCGLRWCTYSFVVTLLLWNLISYGDNTSSGRPSTQWSTVSCLTWCWMESLGLCLGIIESDDIKAVTDEIDRAVVFSNQASSLVDSVKGKYKSKAGSSSKVSINRWCAG